MVTAKTTVSLTATVWSTEPSEDNAIADTPQISEPDADRDDVDVLSTISPTIPAPSPLPEDSPHKYGLRDEIDTPEVPDVPENIALPKARRKSSGPELFNDSEGRRKRHNFKSSGFAYTRPLTLNQIKCYRGHDRLLLSRNKHAPVECAVCHIDDDAEHFSCSWCALRMCKFCRKDFAARGIAALRERIKLAELGGRRVDSAHSSASSESLEALAKLTSAYN
ncbi:uncharacterized protein MYCFIDRAFT_89509 [Pseudocercospora fijiensis CIRAD86]|uniref:Uncharacterized protein n=1 Tax=Pseudocercospora fijiensis (strain CIRAD86) TaxID=383855 RepID=N1QAG0_PSEFD|nr:uncharacterized protein MYCFIDRAFT_89509 [Pseudocercospora fijiensis CIRAD86]EME87922.1 hypothetical protein MYCFIDRAFT_89509 [Pseudocercospora fijiensis CIRAD86]